MYRNLLFERTDTARRARFVEATYNAARAGQFEKPITVSANVDSGMAKLMILGEVAE